MSTANPKTTTKKTKGKKKKRKRKTTCSLVRTVSTLKTHYRVTFVHSDQEEEEYAYVLDALRFRELTDLLRKIHADRHKVEQAQGLGAHHQPPGQCRFPELCVYMEAGTSYGYIYSYRHDWPTIKAFADRYAVKRDVRQIAPDQCIRIESMYNQQHDDKDDEKET